MPIPHQPRLHGAFPWLWRWGGKAREKRPGDEVEYHISRNHDPFLPSNCMANLLCKFALQGSSVGRSTVSLTHLWIQQAPQQTLFQLVCFVFPITEYVMVPQRTENCFFPTSSYSRASPCKCMHNKRKDKRQIPWTASRGLNWENKTYKLKRSIALYREKLRTRASGRREETRQRRRGKRTVPIYIHD